MGNIDEMIQWQTLTSNTDELGCSRLFAEVIKACQKSATADKLKSKAKARPTREEQQRLLTTQWVGYNHPKLNKMWKNQIIEDGQYVFIPEAWLEKDAGIDKLQARLKSLVREDFSAQQTPLQTRQQLQQAGLGGEAEKMYRPISAIPRKTMLQVLKKEGEIALAEVQQKQINGLFQIVRSMTAEELRDTSKTTLCQQKLVETLKNNWGGRSPTGNLAVLLLTNEWINQQAGKKWKLKDLTKNVELLQQTFVLLGAFNEIVKGNVGLLSLLDYFSEQQSKTSGESKQKIKNFWFDVAWKTTNQQGDMLVNILGGLNMAEIINSLGQIYGLVKNRMLKEGQALSSFKQITPNQKKCEEAIANLSYDSMAKTMAYIEELKRQHIRVDLNWIKTTSWIDHKTDVKHHEQLQTLWADIVGLATEKYHGEGTTEETWIADQVATVKFFLYHQLNLKSQQAQEDIIQWLATSTGMGSGNKVNYEGTTDYPLIIMAEVILQELAKESPSAYKLLTTFIDMGEINYQKDKKTSQSWEPQPTQAEKLAFLTNHSWLSLDKLNLKEKQNILAKIEQNEEPTIKEALPLLRKKVLRETVGKTKQSKPWLRL